MQLQQLGARDQEISELQEKLRTAQGNTPFASPPPATEDQEKNEESARLKEELAETRADLQKNQEVVQELERIKLDLQKKEEEEEELERVKADLRKKVEVEEELFRIRADLQKKAEIEEELASIRADLRKKDQVEQELATVKADLQKKREIEEELARARADLQQRDEELTHFKDTVRSCCTTLLQSSHVHPCRRRSSNVSGHWQSRSNSNWVKPESESLLLMRRLKLFAGPPLRPPDAIEGSSKNPTGCNVRKPRVSNLNFRAEKRSLHV